MKGSLTLVLAAAGLSLGGCYGKSNDAGPATEVDVQALYAQMCARCHGVDGRGDAEMKKTIPGIQDFSLPSFRGKAPEEIEAVIMSGRNQMPGFGAALTRPKIQHLGGYARHLGEVAARAGAGEAVPPPPPGVVPLPGQAGQAQPGQAQPVKEPGK